MLPKSWWGKLITGVIMLIGLSLILGSELGGVTEMNNLREKGYLYSGNATVTEQQYDELKQYDGFHGGEVKIIDPNPLTVEYYFPSFTNYEYLSKTNWSGEDKFAVAITPAFLFMFMALPLMIIVASFVQLYNERHPKTTISTMESR